MVTGPSLTRLTAMCAPNTPVSTAMPRARQSATTRSYSGSAASGRAAAVKPGRLPPRAEPIAALPEEDGTALVEPDASAPEHQLPALGIDVDGVAAGEAPGNASG